MEIEPYPPDPEEVPWFPDQITREQLRLVYTDRGKFPYNCIGGKHEWDQFESDEDWYIPVQCRHCGMIIHGV